MRSTRQPEPSKGPWDLVLPVRHLSAEELTEQYPSRQRPEPESEPILPYASSARERAVIQKQRDLEKTRKR